MGPDVSRYRGSSRDPRPTATTDGIGQGLSRTPRFASIFTNRWGRPPPASRSPERTWSLRGVTWPGRGAESTSQLRVGFLSLSLPKPCCPPLSWPHIHPSVSWEPVHPDVSAPRSGPRGLAKAKGGGGGSPFPAQPGFAALRSIPQSLGDEIWAGAVAVATTHHLLMTLEPTCSAAGSDLLVRFPLVGSAQQRALPTGRSGSGSGRGAGGGGGGAGRVRAGGLCDPLSAPSRPPGTRKDRLVSAAASSAWPQPARRKDHPLPVRPRGPPAPISEAPAARLAVPLPLH